MSNIEYVNYNSYRRPKLRISTMIYTDNGKKYVKKTGIDDSEGLIKRFENNYTLISDLYSGIIPLKGETEGESVVFDYIEGDSLDSIIIDKLITLNKEDFLSFINNIVKDIFNVNKFEKMFVINERFIDVFGEVKMPDETPNAVGLNIDMLFSNIIKNKEQYINFDYEWVFDFPIPLDFPIYRTLYYFYVENKTEFEKKEIELGELLMSCGITDSYVSIYKDMEASFQRWVFGEDNYISRYYKNNDNTNLNDLVKRDRELRSHINYLDSHIEELGRAIDAYKSENERLNKENDRITGENERLVDDNDILQFDNRQKDLVILDRETNLGKANAEIGRLNNEINRLNEEVGQLRQHIIGLDTYRQTWEYYYNKPVVQVAKYPYRLARKMYDGTVDLIKGNKNKEQSINNNSEDTKNQDNDTTLSIPKCTTPVVSIVIPAYNQFEYTYECVKSIIEFTKDIPYEIILADDCSTDKTKDIEKYIDGIIHIRNKDNLRFLKNCNNAATYAKGKYILFLNNDTRVTEEWLSSLVELIESDNSIGMVGSKLLYPDGKLQEAGGIIWKDASAWNYGNGQDPEAPEYNYVRDVDYISGAAIMIKTDLWKQLGGFDERFAPAYCEDSDLAFQVRDAGYRVVYQPQSVVVHYEGVSNGTDTSSGQKKYQVVNNEKLRDKWRSQLQEHYENGEHVLRAKDRCFAGKKMILFIDHYVPHFDQDAGSRTVFQYLKLFLSKGYDVKFIGDNYYKHEPYTTVLNQMGIEVLHGVWYSQHIFEWLKDNEQDIDFVFTNRPHITEKYIDFIKENMHAKIIYYGHDLHFLRLTREYEMTGDEYKRMESKKLKRSEFAIFDKADVIYYPSSVEIDMIHSINPDLYAKALLPYVYDEFYDYERKSVDNSGILFVGGFAHGPNVDAVQWFIKEVYPTIKEQNIPFIVAGSHPPDDILAMKDGLIDIKGYVSDEELERLYKTCKMVVVPLRYGAGIKGKVVEAIYQGVPVVTTGVGAEGIVDGESILVIEDEAKGFAQKVLELYSDNDKLDNISHDMLSYIKRYNSVDAAWNIISEDF